MQAKWFSAAPLPLGGLEVEIINGRVKIIREGRIKKFVSRVEQVTFGAGNALKNHQEVLYVTERATFRLTQNGLELIEFAPGIDVERDILAQMEFQLFIACKKP